MSHQYRAPYFPYNERDAARAAEIRRLKEQAVNRQTSGQFATRVSPEHLVAKREAFRARFADIKANWTASHSGRRIRVMSITKRNGYITAAASGKTILRYKAADRARFEAHLRYLFIMDAVAVLAWRQARKAYRASRKPMAGAVQPVSAPVVEPVGPDLSQRIDHVLNTLDALIAFNRTVLGVANV